MKLIELLTRKLTHGCAGLTRITCSACITCIFCITCISCIDLSSIDYITKNFDILPKLGVNLCKRGSVINLKHQLTGYRMYWYISAYKPSQMLLSKIIRDEYSTYIILGKPLFEMCCFHMGIARKGGGVLRLARMVWGTFSHACPGV